MCLGKLGTVTEVWDEKGVPLSFVAVDGRTERACLLGFPDARVGSDVLVHMGFVVDVLAPAVAEDARRLRTSREGER